MMNTWQFIQSKLSASVNVILLYVLESRGSSPGRQGFMMAVSEDNDFCGSIGGGIMEHKFVELAKARLQSGFDSTAVYKQVHDKASANQSGMICSGEQTIFLYPLKPGDINAVNGLVESMQNSRNGCLQLSHEGISFSNEIPEQDFYFEQQSEKEFLFIEKTGLKNKLHIIGGGHCALALSKLMREMDFYITLYDERPELNTLAQNQYAHEIKILSSYESVGDSIDEGDNVYVVIMTFGYRTDDIALRSLINKKFRYLGVLGSKKKMEKLFAEYRLENISEAQLANIHSPIGVQIKSQTTPEIAVSIAAEIIAVKNRDQ